MSNAEKLETFFPGQRKKMLLKAAGTGPLIGKDSQRRIRLSLKMLLGDGKLTGMPEWIGDIYNLLVKEGSVVDDPKILVQLDGVNVAFFATDKSAGEALKLEGCMLHSFTLARGTTKKEGELPPIDLYFTLKTNGWVPKLWTWLAEHLNSEFWMEFEGTQMALVYVGAAAKGEEEEETAEEGELLRESEYEETRRKSTEAATDLKLVDKPRNQMSKKQREAADALDGRKKVN